MADSAARSMGHVHLATRIASLKMEASRCTRQDGFPTRLRISSMVQCTKRPSLTKFFPSKTSTCVDKTN
eukprot:3539494-Amphidinium_carterae.1